MHHQNNACLHWIAVFSWRDGKLLALAMIDIDYFKLYNDSYGHIKGDEILKAVAEALSGCMKRSGDYCFRLGGEEFGVVFTSSSIDEAIAMTERLRRSVEALKIRHCRSRTSELLTASLGLCTVDFATNSGLRIVSEMLYQKADEALYSAKREGRNRARVSQQC